MQAKQANERSERDTENRGSNAPLIMESNSKHNSENDMNNSNTTIETLIAKIFAEENRSDRKDKDSGAFAWKDQGKLISRLIAGSINNSLDLQKSMETLAGTASIMGGICPTFQNIILAFSGTEPATKDTKKEEAAKKDAAIEGMIIAARGGNKTLQKALDAAGISWKA